MNKSELYEKGMNPGKRLIFWLMATTLIVMIGALLLIRNQSAKSHAIQHFHEVGRNPRLTAFPNEILAAFGRREATAILGRMAATYPEFSYDGARRFCQVHRQGYRSQTGYADTILLSRVDADHGAEWLGPVGLRVKQVEFGATSVNVFVYGSFRITAEAIEVPEDNPIRLSIPWNPHEDPEPGRLEDLIAEALN